ncbi:glycosyltransferase [Draconibacterium sp.]|nr:glycosyltransferase [Draconibacterium sp.]
MKKINCFITYCGEKDTSRIVSFLNKENLVNEVYVISNQHLKISGAKIIITEHPNSTECINQIVKNTASEFSLLALQNTKFEIGQFGLERLVQIAENTGAAMVYSDYYEIKNGVKSNHPVIDYQEGSLRDDFNFGPVQFYRTEDIKDFNSDQFTFAGYYALRLHASRNGELMRIPEFIFTSVETDTRQSGEKQFDYVSGNAREKQIEMEKACTAHLKQIGAFLQPAFKEVDVTKNKFSVEASVIIPVWNRIKTLKDAVESVLSQKTKFNFNLIVVDNHSTDGTTELLSKYSEQEKLIHIIPEQKDLGIGGCWNKGLFHDKCGKFAVQLDSDDLYASENTLQTIVDKFYEEKCAMVIGSYRMTNFDLEEIPPGIIDHKEWTDDNGPNNALRINGLGAPRAFFTPVLRKIRVPNVSYGEDYAVGLAISREYKIGRIYIPIYLCRRWEDNSDASLDIQKQNAHNTYKDRVRTIELKARKKKVNSLLPQ